MNKERELKKISIEIRKSKKCSLSRQSKNAVPGEGPANAQIMIIGQAPGVEEDRTGRPFMGRAGRFLNQLLEIAHIGRKKVFITSVEKYFPPKNRKPTKKEIEACLPYLKKQIEIINPKSFILLGEVAFSTFFPEEKLSKFRGKFIKIKDKKYFVTYHPAAGLRFPKIKKILIGDFRKLKSKF